VIRVPHELLRRYKRSRYLFGDRNKETGKMPVGPTDKMSVLLSAVPAIGITGGISTGKTTFVNCLRELLPEAKFFDADAMARELTHHDQAVLSKIREKFGNDVFDANGELNRTALRTMVFQAPEKRRELEQILHPPIRQHWSREAEQHRQSNEYFFADIPLLYEAGGEKLCDRVVVVACSEEVQMQRLMVRTGLDRNSATAIIAAQISLAEKIKRADHVVWNNGPQGLLTEQARFLSNLWTRE
jgi:dephospho-CoA kinase